MQQACLAIGSSTWHVAAVLTPSVAHIDLLDLETLNWKLTVWPNLSAYEAHGDPSFDFFEVSQIEFCTRRWACGATVQPAPVPPSFVLSRCASAHSPSHAALQEGQRVPREKSNTPSRGRAGDPRGPTR